MIKVIRLFLAAFLFLSLSCKSSIVPPEVKADTQFVQIHYKYSFQNELNTFENTYQKDLVMDGTIKVTFWLTEDEQNKIINKANEFNYFQLPDNFPRDSTVIMVPDPGKQSLRIKYKDQDKTISWFIFPEEKENLELNSLKKLASYIEEIIYNKPEYKKLPPIKGARL